MGYDTWAAGQGSKDQNIMAAFSRRMEWKVLAVFTRFLLKNLCEPAFPTGRSIFSTNHMQMRVRERYNGLDNNRLN